MKLCCFVSYEMIKQKKNNKIKILRRTTELIGEIFFINLKLHVKVSIWVKSASDHIKKVKKEHCQFNTNSKYFFIYYII